jgi:hypothetical protein
LESDGVSKLVTSSGNTPLDPSETSEIVSIRPEDQFQDAGTVTATTDTNISPQLSQETPNVEGTPVDQLLPTATSLQKALLSSAMDSQTAVSESPSATQTTPQTLTTLPTQAPATTPSENTPTWSESNLDTTDSSAQPATSTPSDLSYQPVTPTAS